ncbi:MAG: hypothetical protein OXR66_08215 [Candidatus Woesearchaeota archaeon]|nr:hypothetical protein [Candidatus Woesearchaeota archaeon]
MAIVLLRGITKAHAFASGNRRTAILVTKEFLLQNEGEFSIPDDPENARVLQGVREDFYSTENLKTWLQTGDIHEFTR